MEIEIEMSEGRIVDINIFILSYPYTNLSRLQDIIAYFSYIARVFGLLSIPKKSAPFLPCFGRYTVTIGLL